MEFFGRPQQSHLKSQGVESFQGLNETSFSTPEVTSPPANSPLYPVCALCHAPIQNIIVQAMDKTWHPQHFRCTHCHIPISTQKFHVHNDRPYCVEDYAVLFLKKCQGCKLPIKDIVVTALGQTWHPDHFVCISCGTKLLYKGFYEKEENAFCTDCYEGKFCPTCCGCGQSITDTAIKVAERKWHEACFKCGRCRRPISGPTFRVRDAEVICVNCGQEEVGGRREEVKNDASSYFEGESEEEDEE